MRPALTGHPHGQENKRLVCLLVMTAKTISDMTHLIALTGRLVAGKLHVFSKWDWADYDAHTGKGQDKHSRLYYCPLENCDLAKHLPSAVTVHINRDHDDSHEVQCYRIVMGKDGQADYVPVGRERKRQPEEPQEQQSKRNRKQTQLFTPAVQRREPRQSQRKSSHDTDLLQNLKEAWQETAKLKADVTVQEMQIKADSTIHAMQMQVKDKLHEKAVALVKAEANIATLEAKFAAEESKNQLYANNILPLLNKMAASNGDKVVQMTSPGDEFTNP